MNPFLAGALILFAAFLLFDVVWSAFLIYHLVRFSPQRDVAWIQVSVYLLIMLLALGAVAAALVQVDWSVPLFSGSGAVSLV